jgi:flagellar basal-body rod modification protein FlgD
MTTPSTLPSVLPSGITAYDPTATTVAKNNLGTSAQDNQDNFMRMLLAQIQNQDPLSPQDPSQMTSQLSQLNMASGIEKMNASITSMLAQMTSQTVAKDVNLMGTRIMAPGSALTLGSTDGADFGLKLPDNVTQTTVSMVASDGTVVDELSLGALTKGAHTFNWDGNGYDGHRVAPGKYTVKVVAATAGGTAVAAVPLTSSLVQGIDGSTGQSLLLTADGRSVASSDVVQIIKP